MLTDVLIFFDYFWYEFFPLSSAILEISTHSLFANIPSQILKLIPSVITQNVNFNWFLFVNCVSHDLSAENEK